MKIIFDRCALDGANFDLIQGSPLLRLTQERKVMVYFTTVFLEETLRMRRSRKANASAELKRQWPYLCSICNGGWFFPLVFGEPGKLHSICETELLRSKSDIDWPLVPQKARALSEAKLSKVIEENASLAELDKAVPIWDENEQKKKMAKAVLVGLRNERLLKKGETFDEYLKAQVEYGARHLISKTLALDDPQARFSAWKREPNNSPHFNAYLATTIYGLYDAERNQNSRLDLNWYDDAEQLCFLLDVDALVSSDQSFMKRAFEEVWKSRGKQMFTPDQFVSMLRSSFT
jgi:hypothetical protein